MKKIIKPNSKGRRAITLSIRADLLDEYNTYCEKHGMVLSRKVEILLELDLKKNEM